MKKKIKLDCETQFRYTPDVGVVPEGAVVLCGVCGDEMIEKRGELGATTMMEAMFGDSHKYDCFDCPNRNEGWHVQVVAINKEIKKTPSGRIAGIMRGEAESILKLRQATKKVIDVFG